MKRKSNCLVLIFVPYGQLLPVGTKLYVSCIAGTDFFIETMQHKSDVQDITLMYLQIRQVVFLGLAVYSMAAC